VQERLSKLQSSYTVCSAICANSSASAGIKNDLANHGIETNVVKSVISDLMHDIAQSVLQLVRAKTHKLNHIAGGAMLIAGHFRFLRDQTKSFMRRFLKGL
jgi:hypothetical protein